MFKGDDRVGVSKQSISPVVVAFMDSQNSGRRVRGSVSTSRSRRSLAGCGPLDDDDGRVVVGAIRRSRQVPVPGADAGFRPPGGTFQETGKRLEKRSEADGFARAVECFRESGGKGNGSFGDPRSAMVSRLLRRPLRVACCTSPVARRLLHVACCTSPVSRRLLHDAHLVIASAGVVQQRSNLAFDRRVQIRSRILGVNAPVNPDEVISSRQIDSPCTVSVP
jgi:hypothetical protein